MDLITYGTPLHILLTQTRLVWNPFRKIRPIFSHKVLLSRIVYNFFSLNRMQQKKPENLIFPWLRWKFVETSTHKIHSKLPAWMLSSPIQSFWLHSWRHYVRCAGCRLHSLIDETSHPLVVEFLNNFRLKFGKSIWDNFWWLITSLILSLE